eukprot:gene4609-5054_t
MAQNGAKILRQAKENPDAGRQIQNQGLKGRERFHPFSPGHRFDYRPPVHGEDWYVKYSGDRLKLNFECCSQESVSFHYLKVKALYLLFDYFYNCPSRGQ